MNCLEFRRRILASPREVDPACRAHARDCSSCAEFLARADAIEEEVEQTIRVPVPEGLADRIILRHKFGSRRRFSVFALAATLLLTIGVTFTYSYFTSKAEIAEALIAHVLHEPESLWANQEVPGVKLASALAQAGGTLRGPIGKAVYYNWCPLPGGEGSHLAFETPFGRATVLLLPKKVRDETATLQGFSAAVLLLGRGSIGVVADSPKNLERMSQLLREQVRWDT
jgi:hypothetical protein